MRYLYINLLLATVIYGEDINTLPSYQGFRGAINTPNSEIMREGEFEFLYTNQIENLIPSSSPDFRDNKEQKNFFLNIGVLPNLDLNFQYAYGFDHILNEKYISNRVVNAKYQIPFIPKNLFQMAIGVQDIGGGNPYIGNKYAVISKEFNQFRTNLGYAKGDRDGSIDGVFGSVEYQPFSWLQIVGEYDTKEWNSAIKSKIPIELGTQTINLGLMAKSSLDYNNLYFGLYANMPFNNNNRLLNKKIDSFSDYPKNITDLKLSNVDFSLKGDRLYFEYENSLYAHNDIDALGMVLGILTTTTKAKEIVVTIKKANIAQYTVIVNSQEYKKFLKTGKHRPNLLHFTNQSKNYSNSKRTDRFKPTITIEPDFVLIDGSEYSDVMDYSLAMQTEVSIPLAKGTIVSGRYNIPLTMSDNFKQGGIFAYRNRDKTTAEIDQILLTQYLKIDTSYPWVSVAQVGRFDKELEGVSFESGVSDRSGRNHLLLKVANLKDSIENMDSYSDNKREERLLSYRYYLDGFNSNIKLTAGEFLYGDKGESLSLERYFDDILLRFDLARTKHNIKGINNIAKLTISIPFGAKKRFQTDYFDIQGGDITYEKRKNIVGVGKNSYALPHHLKEIDNSFTLERYYMDNDRFHPAYIKANYNHLRNIFLDR